MIVIWNDENDAAVARMVADGKTYQQVADHFGVSKNSIVGRIDRIRRERKPPRVKRWTSEEVDRLVAIVTARPPAEWDAAIEAAMPGRSIGACHAKIVKLRLATRAGIAAAIEDDFDEEGPTREQLVERDRRFVARLRKFHPEMETRRAA